MIRLAKDLSTQTLTRPVRPTLSPSVDRAGVILRGEVYILIRIHSGEPRSYVAIVQALFGLRAPQYVLIFRGCFVCTLAHAKRRSGSTGERDEGLTTW